MKYKWNHLRHLAQHPASRKSRIRVLLRSASWVAHGLLRVPATIKIGQDGARLRLPPRLGRGGGSTGIYIFRDDYEPEFGFFQSQLSPGLVVVDGGANLGIYTVVASKRVGEGGKVLSFEPSPVPFKDLQANIALNRASNVSAYQAALSDRDGHARLYQTESGFVGSSLVTLDSKDADYEDVPITTLDDALAGQGIDRVDVLKLDVEGAEELALRGARSMFTRAQPLVLFEMRTQAPLVTGTEQQGAWNFLRDLGYRFYTVEPGGGLRPLDSPRAGNIVASPTHLAV